VAQDEGKNIKPKIPLNPPFSKGERSWGMDSNIVIAVAGIGGTLLAVVIGALGTYFFQKRAAERQRKWALEDEERRKEHERETEQRKIKRELLCKRLDILEELIKLKMLQLSRVVQEEMGLPYYNDEDTLKEQRQRLQNIDDEAWAALTAIDSKKLTKHCQVVNSAYWNVEGHGQVNPEEWDELSKAYTEIIKLTDGMRAEI
jgi:hypothetical protein